ncbi:MAG: hypothetical protein KF745_05260 [Phycisphaeraceae bacterium]|nr:hypothetical protein [Phycisphaeraceae bacterium]
MVEVLSDGRVTFRMFRPGAESIEVRTDFTGWRAGSIRMEQGKDGWWHAESEAPPGDHLFSYLIDGSTWLPDYAAHGIKANGFGGWVSVLHVPGHSLARAA